MLMSNIILPSSFSTPGTKMTLDRLNDPILSCSKLAPYSNCKAFWQWQHCGDAKQRALTVDIFVLSKRIRCAILWVIDMEAIPIVCSPYGHWLYDWERSGSFCRCLPCRFISLHVLLFDILDRVSPQELKKVQTLHQISLAVHWVLSMGKHLRSKQSWKRPWDTKDLLNPLFLYGVPFIPCADCREI